MGSESIEVLTGMGNREWGIVGMGNGEADSPFPRLPIPDCRLPRVGQWGVNDSRGRGSGNTVQFTQNCGGSRCDGGHAASTQARGRGGRAWGGGVAPKWKLLFLRLTPRGTARSRLELTCSSRSSRRIITRVRERPQRRFGHEREVRDQKARRQVGGRPSHRAPGGVEPEKPLLL